MAERQDFSEFIEERLNALGLLEGLYEVEHSTGLTVGKTLCIIPCYEQLEPFQVVSKVEYDSDRECYDVYTKIYSLQELFYSLSPDHVGKLYEHMENTVNEARIAREEQQVGKEFLTFLNQEMLGACYDIWKQNYSRLFAKFPRELPDLPFFPSHFRIFWKILQSSFAGYFDLTKDIIMGIWLRSILKGLDFASWKWGLKFLIERMFRDCRIREFDLAFQYGNVAMRPLHPETRTVLSKSRLGQGCIGENAMHSCGDMEVHLTTPSLPMYLEFYPNGDARNFLAEVTDMWLSANLSNVANHYYRIKWKFHFTGDKPPGCLYEERRVHEGLFRLGHSFWLMA